MSQGRSELESGNVTDKKPRPKRAPIEIYKIGALSKIRSAKSKQELQPGTKLDKCHPATNLEGQPVANTRKDQQESKPASTTNLTPVVNTVHKSVEKSGRLRLNPSSEVNYGKVLYKSDLKKNDNSYLKNKDDLTKEIKVPSATAKSTNLNIKKESNIFRDDEDVLKVNNFSTEASKSFKSRSFSSNKRVNKFDVGANLPRLTDLKLEDPINIIDIFDNNRSKAGSTTAIPHSRNDRDLSKDVDYFSNQNNESVQFNNTKIRDDQNSQIFNKKPGRPKPVQKSKYGNENKFNSTNENSSNASQEKFQNYNKDTVLKLHYDRPNTKVKEVSSTTNRNKYSKDVKKQSNYSTADRPRSNTKISSKPALIKNLEDQQSRLSVSTDIFDKLTPEKYKSSSPIKVSKEEFGIKLSDKKYIKSLKTEKLSDENKFELEANHADITKKVAICQNLQKESKNIYTSKGKTTSIVENKHKPRPIADIDTYSNIEERLSESCSLDLTEGPDVTKLNYLKIEDLCDETSSQSQDSENDSKIDNPMTYIDYQVNFGKNPQKKDLLITPSKDHYSPKITDMNSICWGDEKWSPALRSQKKKSKHKTREVNFPESPGRRGIIQIGNSNSPMLHSYDSPHNNTSVQNIGQKLLFNPSNPSKPVAVTPSARDLPPSWDSITIGDEKMESDEIVNINHNLVDASSQSKVDPSIFYSIDKGELDINYYVGSNQIPQEFRRIMNIRKHLQLCYYQLLITDIRLCQDKNVENSLWKSLYYVIIEKLREYIAREPTLKERSLSTLLMLVEDGLEYLQKLLRELQNAYGFSLDNHIDEDLMTFPGTKNRVRLALFSCQKILLCLGDLARYKEHYSHSPNFNSAKTWYEKALQVHPRNGRPFNQLAIIAVSQKRPLDVVYYYIRSLTAANPFTSARDSLISMYDDIRKKYESMEKLPSHPNYKNVLVQQEDIRNVEKSESLRQEIWIRPDSGATNKRTLTQSDLEEERNALMAELMQFPPDQLMKHFLTAFLHCHGILFSRVGAEHFTDVLADALNLFHVLMKLTPSRLSPTHLLQIMAVNMFAVDNTQLRGSVAEGELRSAYQANALLLAQEMFARLAETMVSLFPKNFNCSPNSNNEGGKSSFKNNRRDSQGLFMPQLAQYVQAAKVWCDWLLYQSSTWNPPALSDPKLGLDTWGVIGELATIVKGIGSPDVTLLEDGSGPNTVHVVLPEDSFLRGYTPLLAAHRSHYYVPKGTSIERARDWVRISKFQLCLSQFLCGVEPPVLRLQKTDQGEILVPIVAETPPDSPAIRKQRESLSCSDAEVEDSTSDYDSPDEDVDESAMVKDETPIEKTLRALAIQKKNLERKHRQQKRMQLLLEGSVTLEIEVRPRYLVPDTNCFIEHLDVIKELIKKNTYTLMIPLVVMSELDGLSRDTAVEKYGDAVHAINVREGAAAALHYIRSTKHPQLKCVTSQGSILSSTMFTSEIDSQPDVTNDDKILSCCLQYCSEIHQRRAIKKGVRRLYREVVLLTEDRNLRVKAYSRDVPVRDLLDFAHWAGVK